MGARAGLFSVLLPLLLAAAPALAQPAAPRSIRVVTEDNYPPFSFRDDEGELQGLLIDEWRLWEAQTGIKVQLFGLDWDQALRRMKAGEFDVIDTIFRTREWAQDFDFSQPYVTINVPIFFRQDISGITGLKSLKGFPVAAKAGDAIVDVLKNNGISTVLLFTNYQAIVQAAKERKVNVFVADQPSAVYLLQRQGLQDEFRQSGPLLVGHNHRAVQKGNAALLSAIETGFAALKPEEVRQVEEEWYGAPVGGSPALRYLAYVAGVALLLLLGLTVWNVTLNRLVSRRTAELRRTNRTLRMISACNEVLVRVADEAELLQAICRLVVEAGGYRMAWVGFALHDEARSVRPIAHAGFEAGYLQTGKITWADAEGGRGPAGTCIRTGQVVIARDLLTEPAFGPWREEALKRGYAASASLPLKSGDQVLGALVVYASEPGVFDAGEVELLAQLANDLGYGLNALRTREERARAEGAFRASEERLRRVSDNANVGLTRCSRDWLYLSANPACAEILGKPLDQIVGRSIVEVMGAAAVEAIRPHVERVLRGEHVTYEAQVPYAGSGQRYVHVSYTPDTDATGQVVGWVASITDITERKRAEEELHRLSAHLLQAQDLERRRIARELHDTTAQHLAALGLHLAQLRRALPPGSESAQVRCGVCLELANTAAREIRTHSYLLHPPLLEMLGLVGTVEDYAQGFSARSGLEVELEAAADFGRLPEDMEQALFRVIQESLANVLRHSGSRRAKIRLTRHPASAILEVQDMGHGIPADKLVRLKALSGGAGVGLGGMHERLSQLGGRLDLDSGPSGTTVRATVPLAPRPASRVTTA